MFNNLNNYHTWRFKLLLICILNLTVLLFSCNDKKNTVNPYHAEVDKKMQAQNEKIMLNDKQKNKEISIQKKITALSKQILILKQKRKILKRQLQKPKTITSSKQELEGEQPANKPPTNTSKLKQYEDNFSSDTKKPKSVLFTFSQDKWLVKHTNSQAKKTPNSEAQKTEQPKATSKKPKKFKPVTVNSRASNIEKRFYDLSYKNLKEQKYSQAIVDFRSFIEQYPNSPLAANSHYWLGEIYHLKKQLNLALKHFEIVVHQYATTRKLKDAHLRMADTLFDLQLKNDAKLVYQEISEKYNPSRIASLAKKRLKKLF